MAEHTCPLPEPEAYHEWAYEHDDWRAEFWSCPDCPKWYTVDKGYCHECGRAEAAEWHETGPVMIGPELPPEMQPKPPSLAQMFAEAMGEISVQRGGIFYGARPIEKTDEEVRELIEHVENMDLNEVALPEGGIVASGGWCAPSETVYGDG